MKIVLAVLLITVASALDHYEPYSWKRKEDFKVTSRSVDQPIKIKQVRPQRSAVMHTIRKSRLSSPFNEDVLQNSPKRSAILEDSNEQQDPWGTARAEQNLMRENRAIGSTLKNVIERSSLGKLEQYQYFSNFPYNGDTLMENAGTLKSDEFEEFSKSTQDQVLDHNVEEVDWSGQETFEKGLAGELNGEVNIQEFLDDIRRRRLNGELEESMVQDGHRQGRRRKLTSQQQSALLVETLRKKRNYTSDHRGHSSNLQSGFMDMLGRSMFVRRKMEWKYRIAEGAIRAVVVMVAGNTY